MEFTLVAVVLVALFFDFTNGFHDTANSIATSVSTRALTPRTAVVLAAVLNFAGAFVSLEPGASTSHEERWSLHRDIAATGDDDALERALPAELR